MNHRMKPSQYRTPLRSQLSLTSQVENLQPGQAVTVAGFPPYWDVAARRNAAGRTEYIVTDCSRPDPAKPLVVHGPDTKAECVAWARLTARLWASLHGQSPDEMIW